MFLIVFSVSYGCYGTTVLTFTVGSGDEEEWLLCNAALELLQPGAVKVARAAGGRAGGGTR